jgi:D-alanyl-D-alanine carboxypeptidase (penicillin-binding protein 5/6)
MLTSTNRMRVPSRRGTTRGGWWVSAGVVVLIVIAAAVQLLRPTPAPTVHVTLASQTHTAGTIATLSWPTTGESAVAVSGLGVIGTSGPTSPTPIASIAKVMTAYLTLKEHPLASDQSGPTLTMSAADAEASHAGLARSESELVVSAGERLSERQALQALLIDSANDMADVLARFDAGSIKAFLAQMNREAQHLAMTDTHYTDPSGYLASTVSTPTNLLSLAAAAMTNPTFRQIVAMPQVQLPGAGLVYNYNYLIGHDGITGIKTGSSSAAGGCLLFAAKKSAGGHPVTVYGAILGQGGRSPLNTVMTSTRLLLNAVTPDLAPMTVLTAGTVVAVVHSSDGASLALRTEKPLTLFAAPGMGSRLTVQMTHPKAGMPARATVTARIGSEHATVVAVSTTSIRTPSLTWRLRRIP